MRTSPSIALGDRRGDAEVGAAELPTSLEAGVARPVGELLHAAELDLQAQRPGHRPDGGVALDHVALAVGVDRTGRERDRRPQGHVDHVGLEDVRVPVRDAGVDGVDVDDRGDRRRLERVADHGIDGEAVEAAPDLGHAEVPDGEADRGVGGVEGPGAGGEGE